MRRASWRIRPPWLLLATVLLASCGPEATGDDVARVGDWTLTAPELAELLVLAQPFPLEHGPVEELVRLWVGAAAFAQQASVPGSLEGEEAVRASTWLERREALLTADREERLGAEVDGLGTERGARAEFEAGRLRLVAHVLRRVGPETSAAERDLQRRTTERILDGLVQGGDWSAAVGESEDLETRDRSGLLGLVAPGELPASLDRVAFRMEPGQVSSVVASDQGFHILYRPVWDDVSDLFAARLRERRLAEADAASNRGLLDARGYAPAPDLAPSLRRLAQDPLAGLDARAELAAWDAGALDEATAARYLAALPAEARTELAAADDALLGGFAERIAEREVRVRDAGARGLSLDTAVLDELVAQHRSDVEAWIEALGLEEDRPAAPAALRRYMEAVAARRIEARPLPPLLEAWLLRGVAWHVDTARIPEALAEARAMLEGVG